MTERKRKRQAAGWSERREREREGESERQGKKQGTHFTRAGRRGIADEGALLCRAPRIPVVVAFIFYFPTRD